MPDLTIYQKSIAELTGLDEARRLADIEISFSSAGHAEAQAMAGLNGAAGEIAYQFYAESGTIMDRTLEGGSHGVRMEPNTANWLVDSVTFRGQTVGGFTADSVLVRRLFHRGHRPLCAG
jgi:hypothetical protein